MFPVADRFSIYVTSDPTEHLRQWGLDGFLLSLLLTRLLESLLYPNCILFLIFIR